MPLPFAINNQPRRPHSLEGLQGSRNVVDIIADIPRFQDIMRAPALEFLPAYLPTFDERRLAGQLGLWTAAALVYAAATRESLALWTLSAGSEKACEPCVGLKPWHGRKRQLSSTQRQQRHRHLPASR